MIRKVGVCYGEEFGSRDGIEPHVEERNLFPIRTLPKLVELRDEGYYGKNKQNTGAGQSYWRVG
jgi:hypothetical protein